MSVLPARGALRWIVAAGALVYAVAALGSGLDRIAGREIMAEGAVPAIFRSEADVARARLAVSRQDGEAAVDAGQDAVRKQPFYGVGAGMLASGYLLSGDTARADAAYRVSAAGGWREPATQLYWAQQTLELGEYDLAAARIDAILRAHPILPQADELRAELEASPEGREALAARLAEQPVWLLPYLTLGAETADATAAARVDVLERLANRSGPLGCEKIAMTATALVKRSLWDVAEAVWSAHCPDGVGLARKIDGGFAGEAKSPFAWQLMPSGDVSVSEGGGALRVANRGRIARVFATRLVRFAPGKASVEITSDGAKDMVAASLDCGDPARPSFGRQDAISVPDCSVQILSLWARPGTQIAVESVKAGSTGS
ncbi:hypothetical protein [Croceicoccus gelatinilyticus]|uniref:hypothetical protein n=1 Tax=Croceicoccus gelatinilyticus TaxID=2835536 RepID=UPI001BCF0420|nr:hypothetical protein [Croceicoccus gelatinilyticus]MBS7669676.1 hypothetical protein [Croceicoccus gelatinilyticus]